MIKRFSVLGKVICSTVIVFSVSACSGSGNEKVDSNDSVINTLQNGVLFDGKTSVEGRVVDLLAPYTIDVELKSKSDAVKLKRSDTAPPMPFLAGNFAVYQLGGTYGVSTNGKIVAKGGNALERQRLVLSVDETGLGQVYVQGELLWSGPTGNQRPLKVGRGFLNRFWEGSVFKFDIYGVASNSPTGKPKYDLQSLGEL
jgi:hypothetical protein